MKIGILAAGDTPPALKEQYPSFAHMTSDMIHSYLPRAEFEYFDVRDNQFPEQLDEMVAWVITGSVHCANEELPWMLKLEGIIKELHQNKQCLIGICFGHQIIAKALGGTVEQFNGGWGVGLHKYQWQNESHQTSYLPAFHQDQVVKAPKGAKVLISSTFCKNAGLLYGANIFTCQFHPEFSNDFEQALLSLFEGSTIPMSVADNAHNSLSERASDNPVVGRWIGDLIASRA
ncbi:type 1 glutamine amidotransferase [Vibrio sp. ZSDE26]|uniref:Type 1 glutamine amidotransferase n=1 Tax=Vibrio amylolyticus TaxID=2847292 RepID=A0A9X2BKL9_9VIBR|nr:type 1 glutamine amidotransferase [Vibrio amylolyticus]MCK6262973.1 type 1 glutamine amidotransferase [Vibrio amylolyticus]